MIFFVPILVIWLLFNDRRTGNAADFKQLSCGDGGIQPYAFCTARFCDAAVGDVRDGLLWLMPQCLRDTYVVYNVTSALLDLWVITIRSDMQALAIPACVFDAMWHPDVSFNDCANESARVRETVRGAIVLLVQYSEVVTYTLVSRLIRRSECTYDGSLDKYRECLFVQVNLERFDDEYKPSRLFARLPQLLFDGVMVLISGVVFGIQVTWLVTISCAVVWAAIQFVLLIREVVRLYERRHVLQANPDLNPDHIDRMANQPGLFTARVVNVVASG